VNAALPDGVRRCAVADEKPDPRWRSELARVRVDDTMGEPTHPTFDGLEWPHAEASRFVTVDGLRWHIQQLGSGPATLLIHGTGASSHSWEGLATALAPSFALTIVDLPGHGFSEPMAAAGMTLHGLARQLGLLLSAIGVQPTVIIGHSAGAAVAVRMVLDGCVPPPTVVMAVNGALLPFGGLGRWIFPPMARLLASSFAAGLLARRAEQPGSVARMLEGTGRLPPERSVTFYEHMLRRPSHVQAALDMMAMWDLESLARDLPQLAVPLELITCSEDRAVPSSTAFAVRDARPGTVVHYVRGLGHLAHEEDPESIAALVRAAWRERNEGFGPSSPSDAVATAHRRGA
jgi:magnesium chelatase accessory protein